MQLLIGDLALNESLYTLPENGQFLSKELKALIINQTIPTWANWAAQDQDGKWWVYQAEPLLHHSGWYENEIGMYKLLGHSTTNKSWQQQLYRLKDIQPISEDI